MNDLTDCLYSCRILKQWGLHEVSDVQTLLEIFMGIVALTIVNSLLFSIPVKLSDRPFSFKIRN